MTQGIRFDILGSLRCSFDGEPVELGGAKQQMVLALLLLEANRVVPLDRLAQWVWPESSGDDSSDHRRSTGTLQVYVSNLRRIFESLGDQPQTLITTRKPGYVMHLGESELDAIEFSSRISNAAAAAGSGDLDSARRDYRAALGLWRGEPLAGLPVDVTESGNVTHLGNAYLGVLESLGDVELRLGGHTSLVADLQSWVAANPLNEVLRGHLMLALYRCGRQAEALACYSEGRNLLVEQLGIDPSRALRDLEARILAQDPSLDHLAASPAHRASVDFDEAGSTELRSSLLRSVAWLEIDGKRVPLGPATTTLGRLGDRDVTLDDDRVSRHHAEIRISGESHRIVDVGSSNGTTLNGEAVSDAELSDGDHIGLGDTDLVFRCEPLG